MQIGAGAASLAGCAQGALAPRSYAKRSYDILHASGGLGGTTFGSVSLGPNFGASPVSRLSYAAMNATDVRSELGASFDDPTVLYGKPLILFGSVAWAHD